MNIKQLKDNLVNHGFIINYFNFDNYNYFTFENNNLYYYVENSDYHFINDLGETTITCYLKYDYNTKQQFSYPETIKSYDDLLKFMEKNEIKASKNNKPLKGTCKQKLNFDFIPSKRVDEKEYTTIFDKINLGYREKEIIKNIESIEMNQNDKKYKVYTIIDKDKNTFKLEYYSKTIVG